MVWAQAVAAWALLLFGLRGCASLPHSLGCSTFAAVRLSFRVRNGTGRFPHAVTPAKIFRVNHVVFTYPPTTYVLVVGVVG